MALIGTFEDLSFAELVQLLHHGSKSGWLRVGRGKEQAQLAVLAGEIIWATCGDLTGAEAAYRLLGWQEGEFEFVREVPVVPRQITEGTDGLILEGMKRLDEWTQAEAEMAGLSKVMRLKASMAGERYEALSDGARALLRLVDARRSLATIVRESGLDPTQALLFVSELAAAGVVEEWEQEPSELGDVPVHVPADHPAGGIRLGSRLGTYFESNSAPKAPKGAKMP